MRRLDKQHIIFVAAILLAVAAIGAFRYLPALRQRQTLYAAMERKHRTLEEARLRGARMDALSEQVKRLRLAAVDYEAKIPAGRSFADLWRQIADLMNQHALSDQLVQPGSPVESDGLGAIPLTLSATGSMHDMYAFFTAIERWDRLIRFETIELTTSSALDGTVKLTARAQLYYQRQSD